VEGKVARAGVFGGPDAVLTACAAAVAQFEIGELPALGVGGEAGEAVTVSVGEPQLGAGVWPFLADDHPHPGWPGCEVEHAGDLGHPRSWPHLPVSVIGRDPGTGRDFQDGLLGVLGDGHPHRVGQAPGGGGEPGQELVRAAAGVGADQHPLPLVAGQLRQGEPDRLDVVSGGVGPSVA
jgi:hypothetical protein